MSRVQDEQAPASNVARASRFGVGMTAYSVFATTAQISNNSLKEIAPMGIAMATLPTWLGYYGLPSQLPSLSPCDQLAMWPSTVSILVA